MQIDGRLPLSRNWVKELSLKNRRKQWKIEYWIDDQWQNTFSPKNARLPAAVRILENGDTWVMVVPGRPIVADVPAEMALFGRYEFE